MAKKPIYRSPAGRALWAKVVTPDTKFDANGVYSVKLQVPQDEAAELCAFLDKEVEAAFEQESEKAAPKIKAQLSTQAPYSEVYDDNGSPTGDVEFNFKLKAKGKTKDGREFEQRPVVVDAKGVPILKFDKNGNVLNDGFSIGNGSKIKVAFEVAPYFVASTKKVGLSLRLKAVQVIELKEYGKSNFGFDVEEGGFEYKDEYAKSNATNTDDGNKEESSGFEDLEDSDF